jgi:mannose-6-phosphate isomerase-like protein (cupin superfamily)
MFGDIIQDRTPQTSPSKYDDTFELWTREKELRQELSDLHKEMHNPEPMVFDIETETIKNKYFRNVLYVGNLEVTLMSIDPGENIDREVHDDSDQFIKVESGVGLLYIDQAHEDGTVTLLEYDLSDGIAMVIPAGTYHEIVNTSEEYDLKIYSIYAPNQHRPGRVDKIDYSKLMSPYIG